MVLIKSDECMVLIKSYECMVLIKSDECIVLMCKRVNGGRIVHISNKNSSSSFYNLLCDHKTKSGNLRIANITVTDD